MFQKGRENIQPMRKMEKDTNKENICSGGGGFFTYAHPSTVWEPIRNEMIAALISGSLCKGDKVSSISETAEKYHCGRSTAQKVLESLAEEGIFRKIHGKGYFVNNDADIEGLKREYLSKMESYIESAAYMAKKINWPEEKTKALLDEKLII